MTSPANVVAQMAAQGPPGPVVAASFVWRPDGVASPGVYVTWASLVAAFVAVDNAARKIVSVDDSLAAAHITTGAWGIENVEFRSGGADITNGGVAVINIDEGATFTGTHHLSFDGVNVTDAHTATALVTTAANNNLVVDLRSCSFLQTGGSPAGTFALGAGSQMSLRMYAVTAFGDGTHPVITGSATSSLLLFAYCESIVSANAIDATAGAVVAIVADGSCSVSATQTPSPTVQILDPTPTFVFQPGGTAGGNVYTSSATLGAAMKQCPGARLVVVDDSLGAAHITAGTYDFDQTTFRYRASATGSFALTFDEGATFTSTWLRFDGDAMTVTCAATATVPWTPSAYAHCEVGYQCTLESSGAIAFGNIRAASTFSKIRLENESQLGDGTHNVFNVDAGHTVVCSVEDGAEMKAHAFGGAGTLSQHLSPGAIPDSPQDAVAGTVSTWAQGFLVLYAAATAGNWNPTPATVAAGLDQLAAPNLTPLATGNTGTGTGTVTITTANITKAKNGKMRVSGSCLLTTSASASTLTVQLKRDATNIGQAKTLTVPASGIVTGLDVSIDAIDTAPDTAAHTYTLSVSVSAGTLTVAANSAQIQVVEDS